MSKAKTSIIWKLPADEFRTLVSNNHAYSGVLASLNLASRGNNLYVLKQRIAQELIDDSHIIANHKRHNKKKDILDVLVKNSTLSSSRIKVRVFELGILEEKCSECGLEKTWNNKPIVLQLDHIDGDSTNNTIDNLRILCPNCHSQTTTFGHQKTKSPIENSGPKKKQQRPRGKLPRVSRRKVTRPSKEQLEQLIQTNSWTGIGSMFGVSDNAVRKWAKYYGIEVQKRKYTRA